MDIVGSIFNLMLGSVFSINTYIGIVLGALFTPLWVALWIFIKAKISTKAPSANIVVKEIEAGVTAVKAELDPLVDAAKKSLDEKSK